MPFADSKEALVGCKSDSTDVLESLLLPNETHGVVAEVPNSNVLANRVNEMAGFRSVEVGHAVL